MTERNNSFLSMSAVSRAAGTGRETLRHYEKLGLIKPVGRSAAGYRRFSPQVIAILKFIKQTQLAGFSLGEIRHLLKLREQGKDTCGAFLPLFIAKLKQTEVELAAMQLRREALTD